MKSWHIGLVVVLLAGYVIGAMYPAAYTTVRGKLGV